MQLDDDLLKDSYRTSLVGTVGKNKREIHPGKKNRKVGNSKFYFDREKLLVTFTATNNKN